MLLCTNNVKPFYPLSALCNREKNVKTMGMREASRLSKIPVFLLNHNHNHHPLTTNWTLQSPPPRRRPTTTQRLHGIHRSSSLRRQLPRLPATGLHPVHPLTTPPRMCSFVLNSVRHRGPPGPTRRTACIIPTNRTFTGKFPMLSPIHRRRHRHHSSNNKTTTTSSSRVMSRRLLKRTL